MPILSIRYCGGCNEGYSRVGLVRQIQADYTTRTGRQLQVIYDNQPADMQLIVCGCMAMCIANRQQESLARVTHVIAPDHLDFTVMPMPEIIAKIVDELSAF